MAEVEPLILRFDVDDKGGIKINNLTKDLKGLQSGLDRTGTRLTRTERILRGFQTRLTRVRGAASGLRGALAGLGAGIALGGAVRVITEFDTSIRRVAAVTEATDEELKQLTETARQLGATTQFSATQAASGLEFLGRAGFTTAESLEAIPAVLDLALAATLDLGSAADFTSNILAAFNLEASEAADVADLLAKAAASANTDVTQLAQAIKFAGPVAAALGVTVNDTAAAIGVLSNAGLQATLAGTGLRKVFSALESPSRAAVREIEALGLTIQEVSPGSNSLVEVITRLSEAGLDAGAALEIFGDRGGPAILALTSGVDELEELTERFQDVEDFAQRSAALIAGGIGGSFRELVSAIQELVLSLGDAGLLAALTEVTRELTNLVRDASNLEFLETVFQTIVDNAEFLAAALRDVAIVATVSIASLATVTLLLNPFALATAAVVILFEALTRVNNLSFGDLLNTIVFFTAGVREDFARLTAFFKIKIAEIDEAFLTFGSVIGNAFTVVLNKVKGLLNGLASAIAGILDLVSNLPGEVGRNAENIADRLRNIQFEPEAVFSLDELLAENRANVQRRTDEILTDLGTFINRVQGEAEQLVAESTAGAAQATLDQALRNRLREAQDAVEAQIEEAAKDSAEKFIESFGDTLEETARLRELRLEFQVITGSLSELDAITEIANIRKQDLLDRESALLIQAKEAETALETVPILREIATVRGEIAEIDQEVLNRRTELLQQQREEAQELRQELESISSSARISEDLLRVQLLVAQGAIETEEAVQREFEIRKQALETALEQERAERAKLILFGDQLGALEANITVRELEVALSELLLQNEIDRAEAARRANEERLDQLFEAIGSARQLGQTFSDIATLFDAELGASVDRFLQSLDRALGIVQSIRDSITAIQDISEFIGSLTGATDLVGESSEQAATTANTTAATANTTAVTANTTAVTALTTALSTGAAAGATGAATQGAEAVLARGADAGTEGTGGGLGEIFSGFVEKFKDVATSLGSTLKGGFDFLLGGLQNFGGSLLQGFQGFLGNLSGLFSGLFGGGGAAGGAGGGGLISTLLAGAVAFIPGIGPFLAPLIGGAGAAFGFQRGGFVPGPAGAGDVVPALLTPGELVLNRDQVKALGLGRAGDGTEAATQNAILNALSTRESASQDIQIVNVLDPEQFDNFVTSRQGRQTLINVLSEEGVI